MVLCMVYGVDCGYQPTCSGSIMSGEKGWGVTRVSPIPPWVPLTLLVLPRSRTKHTRAAASTPDPATAASQQSNTSISTSDSRSRCKGAVGARLVVCNRSSYRAACAAAFVQYCCTATLSPPPLVGCPMHPCNTPGFTAHSGVRGGKTR